MKTPLQYQITEFDCGRASLINALLFLLDREGIRPEALHLIERATLDNVDENCKFGYCGSSEAGFRYFANRMHHYHEQTAFPVDCLFISGRDVSMREGSLLRDALLQGCVAVSCLLNEGDLHYALLNGICTDDSGDAVVNMFDPYYEAPECFLDRRVQVIGDDPFVNRKVRFDVFDDEDAQNYNFAGYEEKFALLLRRTDR
ncbi:hypothetical protein [Lachnoclostridium sp. Marseille-P6806]|uniref:hypothetical protein n=1 Tax=Lachnoclostridium sp. Marseille-P6806 TaxID=2364793 RepID=UPI00102FF3E3|nr:hypothetical protein [Lachnoclostridium sp. Marseille-P6806]